MGWQCQGDMAKGVSANQWHHANSLEVKLVDPYQVCNHRWPTKRPSERNRTQWHKNCHWLAPHQSGLVTTRHRLVHPWLAIAVCPCKWPSPRLSPIEIPRKESTFEHLHRQSVHHLRLLVPAYFGQPQRYLHWQRYG